MAIVTGWPVAGNSVTTERLATAVTINGVSFDGSANIDIKHALRFPSSTSTATAAGTTTLTVDSTQVQVFTGSTTQTVQLPGTGILAGQIFVIVNNSTGAVTVNGPDGNTITLVNGGRQAVYIAEIATPALASNWSVLANSLSSSNAALTGVLRDIYGNVTTNVFTPARTSTATAAGTTTMSIASTQGQVFTGSTTQTVKLPTTSVTAGMQYTIVNQSSGDVTVQSSGANTIGTLTGSASPTAKLYVALQDAPTTAAHWREI